jgi:hypothetical protein
MFKLNRYFLCVLLAGCSSRAISNPPPDFRVESADLFLSRANLNETEFEQFKVDGSKLFVECGKIRRGRFIPQQQQVFPVTAEELAELSKRAWQVSLYKDQSFDEPGDNSSLIDPGQAYITLGFGNSSLEIKTSLDAVSSQTSLGETALYSFVSNMRALAGGTLCATKSFYGIR